MASILLGTCRVPYYRQLEELGIPWLDTTVKSGDKVFAPTWKMVMDYKEGKLSEEAYKQQYMALMKESWERHPERWLEVLDTDRLLVGCYCKEGAFCHRRILVVLLQRVAQQILKKEVIMEGEWIPPSKKP